MMEEKYINGKQKTGSRNQATTLGDLPEPLIIHMFSYMDMKEIVKTSVLSTVWKIRWKQADIVIFRPEAILSSPHLLMKFFSDVDRTLMQIECTTIKKFWFGGYRSDVSLTPRSVPKFVVSQTPKLDSNLVQTLGTKWIKFLFSKNIQDMYLELSDLRFVAPDCLSESSTLISLQLNGIDLSRFSKVNWCSLKTLSLKSIALGNKLAEMILLGCPLLESFTVCRIRDLTRLMIHNPKVKVLKLMEFEVFSTNILEISAPFIQELYVLGCFNYHRCILLNVSSLRKAVLDCFGLLYFFIQIIHSISHVDELIIGSELIPCLPYSKCLDIGSPLLKCRHLVLRSPARKCDTHGIVFVLQNSPELETLAITLSDFEDSGVSCCMSWEVDFGEDYLTMQEGNLLRLKYVEIIVSRKLCVGLSSRLGKEGLDFVRCFDVELLEYLLRSAPSIEKLILVALEDDYIAYGKKCRVSYVSELYDAAKRFLISKNQVAEWKVDEEGLKFECSFLPKQ